MRKESLERLPDEQIEPISGGVKDSHKDEYSQRDKWLLAACPFCGYRNNAINERMRSVNVYEEIVCPQCKKVYNIEDCVENYKKYNNEQH